MKSSRPFIIRAVYDWVVASGKTPYLMVDALYDNVKVPQHFVEDDQIVLNIAPMAVGNLSMTEDEVEFDASFSGVITHIYVPVKAVKAVYAYENGKGAVFEEGEDLFGGGDDDGDNPPPPPLEPQTPPKKGRPTLKIVK